MTSTSHSLPLPRAHRPVPLVAASISLVVAAALVLLGPHGTDFAAHLYQRSLFLEHGFRLWNNHWYAGRYSFVGYSVLYYPLAAGVGIAALAIASIVTAVAAFAVLLQREWGPSARPAVIAFALVWSATTVTGAFPFLLGCAFALTALVALQRRRNGWFALLALLTLFSSPLAFAFLAIVSIAAALGGGRRLLLVPAVVLAVAAAVELVLTRLFPAGGTFPFPSWTLGGALLFAAVGAAASWRESQLLRSLFLVYGAACLVAYLVPSELGSNVVRFRYAALPLALLVMALRRFRPRLLAVGAVAATATWNLLPLGTAIVQAGEDPAASARYWQPAIAFLHDRLTPSYRVEAVATADHWEALYLPRAGIPIARGWFRQDDLPQNQLLYEPLTPGAYLAWLRQLGVRYVLLMDAPLDYSSQREAELLRSGRAGLPVVHRFDEGVVYGVPAAEKVITGPGVAEIRSLGDTKLRLDVGASGRYRLAFRYSSYWQPSRGCLTRGGDGMTELSVDAPGPVTLSFATSVGRALAMLEGRRQSCADND